MSIGTYYTCIVCYAYLKHVEYCKHLNFLLEIKACQLIRSVIFTLLLYIFQWNSAGKSMNSTVLQCVQPRPQITAFVRFMISTPMSGLVLSLFKHLLRLLPAFVFTEWEHLRYKTIQVVWQVVFHTACCSSHNLTVRHNDVLSGSPDSCWMC